MLYFDLLVLVVEIIVGAIAILSWLSYRRRVSFTFGMDALNKISFERFPAVAEQLSRIVSLFPQYFNAVYDILRRLGCCDWWLWLSWAYGRSKAPGKVLILFFKSSFVFLFRSLETP